MVTKYGDKVMPFYNHFSWTFLKVILDSGMAQEKYIFVQQSFISKASVVPWNIWLLGANTTQIFNLISHFLCRWLLLLYITLYFKRLHSSAKPFNLPLIKWSSNPLGWAFKARENYEGVWHLVPVSNPVPSLFVCLLSRLSSFLVTYNFTVNWTVWAVLHLIASIWVSW